MRIVRQLVVVAGGRALISGTEAVDVRHLCWADGMRSAWVAYEAHDGLALGIEATKLGLLDAIVA